MSFDIDILLNCQNNSFFDKKQKRGSFKKNPVSAFSNSKVYSTPLHLFIQAIISRRVFAFNE